MTHIEDNEETLPENGVEENRPDSETANQPPTETESEATVEDDEKSPDDESPSDTTADNEATDSDQTPQNGDEKENETSGDDDEGDSDDSDSDSDDDEGEEEDEDEDGDGEEDAEGEALPLIAVVEAILFAAREPLKPAQIARAVGKGTRQDAVRTAVEELNVHYLETGRAFEIAEISERYQLMSRPEYARHIMRIYPKRELQSDKDKTHRLTPAAMDTLAIVAYKQPVMRSEIERIRGVACGPVLKMLIERGSVKQIGRRTDLVGKPAVFGTTEAFLAEFGLGSLEELPLRNEYLPPPGEEPQVELIPDQDEETTAPETAEQPPAEALEAPEASEAPEAPEAPEPPETSEAPEASEATQSPD